MLAAVRAILSQAVQALNLVTYVTCILHIVLQEQPKPSRLATATDTAWTACGKGPSEI